MKYQDQVNKLLEDLHNSYSQLQYMMRIGATKEQVLDWIEGCKQKIDQAITYVNRES